jgi:hypothetical protein
MRLASVVLISVVGIAPLAAQDHRLPPGWSAALDDGTRAPFEFSRMAPGWHITMGPGGVLYPADRALDGRFTLESRFVLFPGTTQTEYGLFIGGRDVQDAAAAWVAFVVRRDGSAAVLRREAGRTDTVTTWTRHSAVKPHPGGDGTVSNVLRVTLDTAVAFRVNDSLVVTLARGQVPTDGMFGFRVGKDVNVHITTLDVLQRLAPAR